MQHLCEERKSSIEDLIVHKFMKGNITQCSALQMKDQKTKQKKELGEPNKKHVVIYSMNDNVISTTDLRDLCAELSLSDVFCLSFCPF